MRTRVYIAGPITKGPLEANIRQATEAGMRLLKAGYAPLVPHLTVYYDGPEAKATPGDVPHEAWIESCLPWVAVCDVLLRLPGESKGAALEEKEARRRSIPVYRSIDQLMAEIAPRWGVSRVKPPPRVSLLEGAD